MTYFRLIVFVSIVALLAGVLTSAPAVYAQTDDSDAPPLPTIAAPVAPVATIPTYTVAPASSATQPTSVAAGGSNAAASSPTSGTPSPWSDPLDYIMSKLMSLFAWLLGIAAITLDNAMYYTVVHMGSYVNGLSAVGVAWRILRDIGNIILIFGFVALGITVILDVGIYGGGTKMLPVLLMAAVFLNFSLFIAEGVIDVGNLFATEFYTQINGGSPSAPQDYGTTAVSNEGISNAVMNQLGLQSIYNSAATNSTGQNANAIFQSGHPFILGFMAILLFMVAAFVFFSLAFVLIARFIFLIFLIIVAPIGFAGLAVPKLEGVAKQWWGQLFEQTLTAPVMLLMLYVAIAVITDSQFLTGFGIAGNGSTGSSNVAQTAWTGWLTNTTGTNLGGLAAALLSFLVAMGLLLAVTILSKKMGAIGGSWATRMGGAVTGGIVGYGFVGEASLAGRIGLGGTGRLLNNKRVQANAAQGGIKGLGWKALSFTGRNLENRTYDPRNIKTLRNAGAAITGALGVGGSGFNNVDLGRSATITAKTAVEATQKAIATYKPFSGDWWRNQQKEYEKADAELKRKQNLVLPSTQTFSTEEERAATEKKFTDAIKKMSTDELAALRDIRAGEEEFVRALSPAKYGELQKSDKLLAGEKTKLKEAWTKQFEGDNAPATMRRFTSEEIASLDGDILTKKDVASNLGANELEAIRRKNNLTLPQRKAIKDYASADTAPNAKKFAEYMDAKNDQGAARQRFWDVE